MAEHIRYKHETTLTSLRAAALAGSAFFGLAAMNVNPHWLVFAATLTVGGLAIVSTDLGVLVALVSLSIPVVAAQPLLGVGMLIAGVAAVRYVGAGGGRVFLIIALALAGTQLGFVWAAAALAGYLLGAGEGALAAAVACVVLEAVGVAVGKPNLGITLTGGPAQALVSFAHAPDNLLSPEWLRITIGNMGTKTVDATFAGFSHISRPAALVIQPALWAMGAVLAGWFGSIARRERSLGRSLLAVALGVSVPALGSIIMRSVMKLPQDWAGFGVATASSLVVAVGAVYAWERYLVAETPVRDASRSTVAGEDADVDELLRLIATAEDKLTTQHTTSCVVMITDMKSFSRMTEEDGSVATAKSIQRHRDLLVPIIERHGGHGKSTGGDGLVASFESGTDSLAAAAEMQRTLASHNAAHPNEREIWVRIGIASGEIVLDKRGRPFIGAALNLAARIMNLADGGQVYVADAVAAGADREAADLHALGAFKLKNITEPIEITELLWAADKKLGDPRVPAPGGD